MSNSNSDSETASLLDNTKLLEKMSSNPNSENASLDNSGRNIKDDELVVEEPSIHQVFAIYFNFCRCFLVSFLLLFL